jgi:hypothetical protein
MDSAVDLARGIEAWIAGRFLFMTWALVSILMPPMV